MASAGNPVCDVCGDGGAKRSLIECSNNFAGCPFARHVWCFGEEQAAKKGQGFFCVNCSSSQLEQAHQRQSRGLKQIQDLKPGAPTKQLINGGKHLMASRYEEINEPKPAKQFLFTSQPGPRTGKEPQLAGFKRPNHSTAVPSRPTSRPRLEQPGPGGGMDLFKSTMQGLQQEQQRRKASRLEPPALPGAHASESRSEQRLKRRSGKRSGEQLFAELREKLEKVVSASTQSSHIWTGNLELQLDESQDATSIDMVAHGVSGNPHSMDAALRLPQGKLTGAALDTKEALEMTGLEASENACLIFRGADEPSQQSLVQTMSNVLEDKIIQVLLGKNRPLWLALIPAPGDTCFGVLVKFDELWKHSTAAAGKSLLRLTKSRLKRKLEWPDGQDSIRRSTDCERGRGSDYGHLRIRGKSDTEAQKNDDCGEPAKSASHAAAPEVPDPGPLACLSVAIVGFQRDHEEIKRLRRDLTAAGAQTFMSPWPGCVKVLVFPEQLFNKELTMENHAPKELQPIKDFQAATGTRIFLRIDYPKLCCQLPTPEEEARHNVKELWPEGVIVTADAATLHAASELPSSTGKCSLLEEVLDELKMAASSARRPGTVWMVTTSGLDLKELESMGSASHRILLKWQQTRRFQLIDPALATRDLILNALKLAQFYRFFCRYTIVLSRPEDQELITMAGERKTIFCAPLNEVSTFLREIFGSGR